MQKLIRYIAGRTYRPLLERYLSKERTYRSGGIRLAIPPQVFHPGFFFSTKLLLQLLAKETLEGKTLLEPGAGSGLISMKAAQKGARVTSTDISLTAVAYLEKNASRNGIPLRIIHSDLFENIPEAPFDYIIVNPPYYKRNPVTELEHAWYCGEKGEYFTKLFSGLRKYIHPSSKTWMVLCDGCDLHMIRQSASEHGFSLNLIRQRRNLVETNFVFSIQHKSA
jgi:release factor glutamine methyltransferase